MSVVFQNSNDRPNTSWFSVPMGALAGAVSGVLVGAIGLPTIMVLISLVQGQIWGNEIEDLGRGDVVLMLWPFVVSFSRLGPQYALIGLICGSLGSAVGFFSRRRKYGVIAGVISGVVISPPVATIITNNIGGFVLWHIFVGVLAGVLATLFAGMIPTMRKGYLLAFLLVGLATGLLLFYTIRNPAPMPF